MGMYDEIRCEHPLPYSGYRVLPGHTLNDEDRAWLENDLSDLQEYGAYEWVEGELESYSPVKFVPGVGLVVIRAGEQAEVERDPEV